MFATKNIGLDPINVWNYTPYEISLIAENYAFKEKEQIKYGITVAYYNEYFARHKKLPKLDKILKNIDNPTKHQSKGDMVLIAMAKEKGVNI